MADVYHRSGRGGAGNFYSQKDIEEATKAATKSEDLEAQKPAPADDTPTDPADPPSQTATASTGTYARTGRGGAGNFVDPASVPTSTSPPPPPGSPTSSANASTKPQPPAPARTGLSGRGGAGNWSAADQDAKGEGEVYDPEQERKRREALDAGILKDIRDSLPQPPKIHYMHGPGRGRKPDLMPSPRS
ncbi:hypothetical protein F4819DRAFT_455447 [Hypoxylon fuscum]|nr:hypothetical protein F4819DRAFT_455447 [Hypoxylon fuscum]